MPYYGNIVAGLRTMNNADCFSMNEVNKATQNNPDSQNVDRNVSKGGTFFPFSMGSDNVEAVQTRYRE